MTPYIADAVVVFGSFFGSFVIARYAPGRRGPRGPRGHMGNTGLPGVRGDAGKDGKDGASFIQTVPSWIIQ